MARDSHLPRECTAYRDHRGSYLIKYFYYQAKQLHRSDPDKHAEPSESFFHYPGPIPQSKESGALMLADVTEAVTRARGEMEEDELRMLLDQIFSEKIEDDQLTDSNLTIGDLEKLKDAYFRVVMGTMHHRVRYPHEIATGIQFHYVADRQEVATAMSGIISCRVAPARPVDVSKPLGSRGATTAKGYSPRGPRSLTTPDHDHNIRMLCHATRRFTLAVIGTFSLSK